MRVAVSDQAWEIESDWIGEEDPVLSPVVFLHDALGSLATWGEFPARLCRAAGRPGLVYSRPGHGRSSPSTAPRRADYLEREAADVLPAVLAAAGVRRPVWLVGHSDGASIALIAAALGQFAVAGVVAIAPHVLVEDVTLDGVRAARDRYERGDLRRRLARFHRDVDGVFLSWSETWLDPAFRGWTLEPLLPRIRCELLLIQGERDEYGTMDQIMRIVDAAPHARVMALPDCGHSPHREVPGAVIAAAGEVMGAESPTTL